MLQLDVLVQTALAAVGLAAAVAHVVPNDLARVPSKPFLFHPEGWQRLSDRGLSRGLLVDFAGLRLATSSNVDASEGRLEVTLPRLVIL